MSTPPDSDAAGSRGRPRFRSTGVRGELIEHLNVSWRMARSDRPPKSLKQRVAAACREVLTRLLAGQETFNARVVQYVNAWQVVDKERSAMLDEALDRLDRLEAANEPFTLFQEALLARERRMDAAVAALVAEHDEIRTSMGLVQSAMRAAASGISGSASPDPVPFPPIPDPRSPIPQSQSLGHSYVGFEDEFRGSHEEISQNLASYVPLFAGAVDVLDVGCGRGEFLSLLSAQGIPARGVDLNASMVDVCREHGLRAETADALGYLLAQPDGSLGGLFAAQVVEHLEPAYLIRLLDTALAKLRPGSPIVLETINPACWFAFFESYVRDITHVRPLHPDTMKFLLVAAGFQQVDIQYRAPYPEHEKLQPVHGVPTDAAETLNANVSKLNRLLFTHLDYAAIAYRP